MVWRGVWGFVFLLSFSAHGALIDSKAAYYGKGFLHQFKPGDSALKTVLFEILHNAHEAVKGDYDRIVPQCGKGSLNCYRHTAVGYKKAREVLFGDFYLVKRGSEYGVMDVYCQRVVDASEFRGDKPGPGQIPDHRTVNAEHTWPQSQFSRGFPGEFQKSDLHHLFPTDSEMNSKRSNLEFGEVVREAEELKCSESRLGAPREGRGPVFEPPPEHKGNVARALFYFSVRYKLSIGAEEEATLREWHREDPVDREESARNERIYEIQKNRNPFVDYPELVERVSDF